MREATKRGAPIEIEDFERRLRNQEAQSASLGDPLRELARLMQGHEGEDSARRYERIFDDHRQAAGEGEPDFGSHAAGRQVELNAAAPAEDFDPQLGWRDFAEPAPGEDLPPPLRGSFSDAHDQDGAAQPGAGWGRRPAAAGDFAGEQDFYPEDVGPGDHHAPAPDEHGADYGAFDHAQADEYYASAEHGAYEDWPAEPYAEAEPEEAGAGRRGFRVRPWHGVALAALVGVAGVGWGLARIKGVAGSREIATIAAPSGPTKVAPAAEDRPSAKEDATVLDRGEEKPVRNVASHQEAPVEPVVEPPRDPSAQTFRRVKTVAIREDNSINPAKAPAAVERAANNAPAAPAVSTTTPQNAAPPATTAQRAQKPPASRKVAAAAPEPAKAAPAEPAKSEEDAASPAQTEAPSHGSAFVQFGAAANEGEARTLAKKVVQKYGSRLGGRRPTWKIAEVGDKTVYRVRVGGLSKEAATSLCKAVKDEGGDCYVANN